MLLSGDICMGCSTHTPQASLGEDGRNTPHVFPPVLSPGFQCNTLTDFFPSFIFTFRTYLRYVTGNVMSWTICGGPHAPYTIKLYDVVLHQAFAIALHLYALTFTLVYSCFHTVHAIRLLFLLYPVPARTY